MSLLDRLRSWLGGDDGAEEERTDSPEHGGSERGETGTTVTSVDAEENTAGVGGGDADDAGTATDDTTETGESAPTGLDPDNVERTRTSDGGDDDAAARLRDLQANREDGDDA